MKSGRLGVSFKARPAVVPRHSGLEAMPDLPSGTVTFLFTDIEGSTQLWEQYPEAMTHALARHDATLRDAIEARGGHVFKTVGDAFYAVFTAAPAAVAAALAAQRALVDLRPAGVGPPLRVRMALHTGAAQERDSDYFGPPLNRVARLLAAGHGGQVLLSLATAGLVRDALPAGAGLRDLGECHLNDLLRPEQVFQLVAPGLPSEFPPLRSAATRAGSAPVTRPTGQSLPVPPASFVGRERELATMVERLQAAGRGEGAVVLVAGEPGIGKTRLVEEFTLAARGHGAAVVWGRCYEGDWAPPFGPWVEALRAYIGTVAPERLREHLGPAAASLARLMPEVRTVLPDLGEPAPLSTDEERFRLYEAVTQLLRTASAMHTLVLVLDDLHWADRDSLALLRHVVRSIRRAGSPQDAVPSGRARLLLIGAYRDMELDHGHPLPDVLAVLRREAESVRLPIRGLSEPEVAQYLTQAAGEELSPSLVQVMHGETDGNPFYLREVFHHLVEEGKLIRRADRWVAAGDAGALAIPEGVRQVIDRRVSRLTSETNTVLRLAAAFTGGFAFQVLQALTDLPEDRLLDCIDEALHAQLIRPAGEGAGEETYDFAHALVRHTLYDELSPSRKVRLHRRIAEALERVYAGHAQSHAAELAAQYHASASLPGAARGIPYALAAADQAKASYAHDRAVVFLRMARDLARESPPATAADILCRLAVAEAEALMLVEAERTVEEALTALAHAGAEPAVVAEFLAVVARALKDTGAPPPVWEPLVERGLALTGDRRDLTWARLMLLRDPIEPVSSGIINAGRWVGFDAQAVAIARATGDEDDYARTLEPFDWHTREETEAILALARKWQRPSAIMHALNVAARELLYRHGAFRGATERFQELLATSERFGSIPQQAEALVHLISAQAALGWLAQARETRERAEELVARLGRAHRLRVVQSFQAYYLDGDWPAIAEARARPLADPWAGRIPIQLPAAAWAAFAYGRAGLPDEARPLLDALTPVLERMDPRMWTLNGAVAFAAAAVWELGAEELAARYHRLALDLVVAGVSSFPIVSNELTVARMAALRGDMAGAREFFARARTLLDAGGQRPERAVVDYDEALALIRAGSRDDAGMTALLDAALAEFRALGMDGWVARALPLVELLKERRRAGARSGAQYPAGLSEREVDVLRLLAAGRTNREIADELVLSVGTVERHIANLYRKIGARGRADATTFALSHGLVPSRTP